MNQFSAIINDIRSFQEASDQTVNDQPTLLPMEECKFRYDLGKEELDEYLEAAEHNDIVKIYDSLVDQLYILIGTANSHGLAEVLFHGFEEVHRSNMTKIGENGKVIRREDGKILKPEGYSKPDLISVLEQHTSLTFKD